MVTRILTPLTPTKTPIVDDQGYVTDLWSAFFDRLLSAVVPTPTGGLVQFAGDSVPLGWLLCDGREVSRTTYSDLFLAIGDKYGIGDGSRTFNLPNLVGRVLIGATDGSELGQTGGTDAATLTQANLPLFDLDVTDPGHTHTFTGNPHTHTVPTTADATGGGSTTRVGGAGTVNTGAATAGGTNSTEDTGITVSSGGAGEPISVLPPYLKVNFIIKA